LAIWHQSRSIPGGKRVYGDHPSCEVWQ
jgi:hypothetical protein